MTQKIRIKSAVLLMLLLVLSAVPAYADSPKQGKPKESQLDIWLEVRNLFTGSFVPDTMTADLLLPDSTLVMSHKLKVYGKDAYCHNTVSFALRSP